jgi:hypothetical protein
MAVRSSGISFCLGRMGEKIKASRVSLLVNCSIFVLEPLRMGPFSTSSKSKPLPLLVSVLELVTYKVVLPATII